MLRVILIASILLFATGRPSNVVNSIDDRDASVRDYIGRELEENEFPGIQYLSNASFNPGAFLKNVDKEFFAR